MATVKILTEDRDILATESGDSIIFEKEVLSKTDPAVSRIEKTSKTYSVEVVE